MFVNNRRNIVVLLFANNNKKTTVLKVQSIQDCLLFFIIMKLNTEIESLRRATLFCYFSLTYAKYCDCDWLEADYSSITFSLLLTGFSLNFRIRIARCSISCNKCKLHWAFDVNFFRNCLEVALLMSLLS